MYFAVKSVEFMGRKVNILLQNNNGPCPLIAIANILLLQGKIKLWKNIMDNLEDLSDTNFNLVEVEEVTHLVAEAIIYEQSNRITSEDNEPVAEVLDLLPKLSEGLDLNVIFTNSTSFEFTREISVFDSLQIYLYHGWLPDEKLGNPLLEEMYCAVKDLSYNHLVFKIVENKAAAPSNPNGASNSENKSLLRTVWLFEQYLAITSSQLTYTGLLDIYRSMQDRQLAVFFRNNHFSTIFCINGQIFSLVTDLGYQEEPGVVWELLDQGCIQGNSDYYDSYFQRSEFALSAPPSPVGKHSADRSYIQEQGTIASPRILQPSSHEGSSEQDVWVRVHASDSVATPPPTPPLPAAGGSGRNSEMPADKDGRTNRCVESDRQSTAHRDRGGFDPAGSAEEPDDLGDLHMTQEERDFQHALMLQMEEDRLDQQSRAERDRTQQGPHNPPAPAPAAAHRAEPLHPDRAVMSVPAARTRGGRAARSDGAAKTSSGCSLS